MKVLLTNDDGFGAEGIEALWNVFKDRHEVYVMAPFSNRSGASHSINMSEPLEIRKIEERRYTCSGSPADCVMTVLKSDFLPRPDIVVSGINRGPNIGTDVVYSGTCGAARQAVLYGVPGVALSIMVEEVDGLGHEVKAQWKYDELARFAEKNLDNFIKQCRVCNEDLTMPEERCIFVNVNALSADSYKGVKHGDISFREYCSDRINVEPCGKDTFRRIFTFGKSRTSSRSYSDYDAVTNGYVAVTPVYAEPGNAQAMDGIEYLL